MKLGLAIAAASLLAVSASAALESGLKPGTVPGAFQVVDVSGPNKGQQLCYRCSYGVSPVLALFVNGDATKAADLVASVQKLVQARQDKGLNAFVVFMGGPSLKTPIEKIAATRKITIPMTFLPAGAKEADIASYKINPSAQNTILLWKETVRGNFVNVDATTLSQVAKAVDKMLL
jgi:hypothetical protein